MMVGTVGCWMPSTGLELLEHARGECECRGDVPGMARGMPVTRDIPEGVPDPVGTTREALAGPHVPCR